jgi:hypothetical protein
MKNWGEERKLKVVAGKIPEFKNVKYLLAPICINVKVKYGHQRQMNT